MKLMQINSGMSLKLLMTKNNVQVKELAKQLDVTEQTIKNARSNYGISFKLLQGICNHFEIKASDYFKLGE